MYQFEIPHELPDLNTEIDNTKRHWSVYSKTKADYTFLCARYAAKMPKIDGRVDIVFTWNVHNQRKDPDNIAFGAKYVLDGMQKACVISNDNFKSINSITHKFTLDKSKPIGVGVAVSSVI